MKLQACLVAMVVAAGCSAADSVGGHDITPVLPEGPELPIDGGPIGPPPLDAPPGDAPGDAPSIDLTEICGAEPVTLEDWEDCYLKRWCDAVVGCSSMNPFRDVQECVARVDAWVGGRLGAERRERKRAVEQGRASLDVAAFAQCLADTSHAFCDTAQFSVACATRFHGMLGNGADCYTDIECSSPGATCESSCSDACCQGTCQPKLEQGQACRFYDSCEPGLVCHNTCRSGDIGTPCGSDRDCDSSAWCKAGTCVVDLAQGAACTGLSQCGGETTCVGLSIIDSRPGWCLRISHAGDPCDFACYGSLYCDASGTCRDLPELGQSCASFIPCRGVDTFCSNGQCVLLGDAGASCVSSQACRPGLFCGSDLNQPSPTCLAPGDTGQPCTDPAHCQSHLCSGTTGKAGVCLAWSDSCPLGGS